MNTTSQEGNNPTTPPPLEHSQGSSKEEPNPKWCHKPFQHNPVTPAQRSVLAKGFCNFAVTPRQPPNLEYITAKVAACTKLSQQDAEELRADIQYFGVLNPPTTPNTQLN